MTDPSPEARGARDRVRIHIDRVAYESPNPTTGKALYKLGDVSKERQLFREVQGNREDELVPREDEEITLQLDEHFYSDDLSPDGVTVFINTKPTPINTKKASYEQIVALAFPPPHGENVTFTLLYRKGRAADPRGSLVAGQSVRVKDGMIFDVTPTDRS